MLDSFMGANQQVDEGRCVDQKKLDQKTQPMIRAFPLRA
jgi:hypothetical protein